MSAALLLASIALIGSIIGLAITAGATDSSLVPLAVSHAAVRSGGTADWIAGIAEAVTALTIFIVIAQLFEARKTARIERTRGFQERYQSDEFDCAARRMLGCMRVKSVEDCVAVIEAYSNRPNALAQVLPWPRERSTASVMDVDRTLNFFEEMGTAFNQKQLNNETVALSFAVSIVDVFIQSWWLICWERSGRLAGEVERGVPEESYLQFEEMILWLRKNDPALAIDPALKPNGEVRALCLPTGSGEPSDDPDDAQAWEASRRLSTALSTFVATADERVAQAGTVANQLSRVSAELETLPTLQEGSEGAKPRGWDLFLVPRQIDQRRDDGWQQQRVEAKWVAKTLDRFENYPSLEPAVARIEEMATAGAAPGGSASTRG